MSAGFPMVTSLEKRKILQERTTKVRRALSKVPASSAAKFGASSAEFKTTISEF
jgi:hypothetical protein